MERIFTFLLMGLLLLVSACGDLNDGKGEDPDRVIDELRKANCTVDTQELEKILTKPIKKEIECIYEQLSLFMRLVRAERPELGDKNISRQTLEGFIRRKIPESKDIKGRYSFISLGCPKNLVDSERIITKLKAEGYDLVDSYDNADMVIVNLAAAKALYKIRQPFTGLRIKLDNVLDADTVRKWLKYYRRLG